MKKVIIFTKWCYEYAFFEDAILKYERFGDNKICEVDDIHVK